MKRQKTIVAVISAALALASCANDTSETAPTEEWDLEATPQEVTWTTGPAGLSNPVSEISGPMTTSPVPHGWTADHEGQWRRP